MQLKDAWALLGLEATDDRRRVREAYLLGVRATHPDVSDATDAHERTTTLQLAYETVLGALDGALERREAATTPSAAGPTVPPAPTVSTEPPITATWIADDTLGIDAPANEALPFLIEACHEVGDVTFLDQRAGLIQVTVGFVDEPVCYLLMNLQGRATGVTEVFCSIESIESTPAPPIGAVTRLLVETLNSLVW